MPGPLSRPSGAYRLRHLWSQIIRVATSGTAGAKHARQATTSESAADRALTQRIQQAVAADELLSTAAKNIKIITLNGVVTLWGPVTSLQEKESIGAKAQYIAGSNNVDNQLELKGP